jgi:3-oxoacyl-[acyl-carrier-protein] synthase-1
MIDYVNLHGTGTRANDTTETKAVVDVLGRDVPCSSTKGFTGHTLGACGIVEVALSLLAMEAQVLPANLNLQTLDDAIEANVVPAPVSTRVDRVVTNSFGFGGNNCSLVLGRAA